MRYLYYCFFLIVISSYSQSKSNLSQKEYLILENKIRSLITSNVDSAFVYTNKLEKSSNYSHQAFAQSTKSYLYQLKGDRANSKLSMNQAFESLKQVQPSKEKIKLNAYLLNCSGLVDWKRGDFSMALDKFQQGKKLSLNISDKVGVIKFNINIGLIYNEIGNYRQAITISKESDKMIDGSRELFSDEQFNRYKNSLNLNIGKYYEDFYKTKMSKVAFLDSAQFYYSKAIIYSKTIGYNRFSAQMNLANIFYIKKNFVQAEKGYQSILKTSEDNGFKNEYSMIIYNLGDLYYYKKEFKKSLVYLKKVDSLYHADKLNPIEFLKSNYYQAKIYQALGNKEEAAKHSEIYLNNFEKSEFKLNNEIAEVNFTVSKEQLQLEMKVIQKEFNNKRDLNIVIYFVLSGTVFFLVLIVLRSIKKKKLAEQKVADLIKEYKENRFNNVPTNVLNKELIKNGSTLISVEKENEILDKLMLLEKRLDYLKPDFTQQSAAKKIKTNTSYLSSVVNNHYNKSFSEYLNELRINYVIDEMISNATYRKYSTQAIAESAGFKNAVSFTKSFNKRTGVTPVQFIKGLDKDLIK
ncbi:Helix-turn-helix domain-containing protein [Flavobacterium frigoris]|uniref:Helix-turn-helix domain-containing protein n=1 Tax=Flavobacterium frigoris TaxID=229204 RepID=A0A1H9NRR5_FLAFI|nr:Helix-turn-helix domain-containing protein [Flavobacterium frigoris]